MKEPAQLTPCAAYPYFDKIQVWLPVPLDQRTLDELKAQYGLGGLYQETGPARFDPAFRQRLELRQPSVDALTWAAGRNDILLNRAEIAVDYIFSKEAQQKAAFRSLMSILSDVGTANTRRLSGYAVAGATGRECRRSWTTLSWPKRATMPEGGLATKSRVIWIQFHA